MLPDVHRDRKDRQGREAQDGHLDLFTELLSSETFSSTLLTSPETVLRTVRKRGAQDAHLDFFTQLLSSEAF